MGDDSEIPKSLDEFKKLLEDLNVKNPQNWFYDFSREKVFALQILRGIWDHVPNPNNAKQCLELDIKYNKRVGVKPDRLPILEKWLTQGIEPKDIVSVQRESFVLGVYAVLQILEQSNCTWPHSIALFEEDEDGNPIQPESNPTIEQQLVGLLMSAMPKDQPDMPEWC